MVSFLTVVATQPIISQLHNSLIVDQQVRDLQITVHDKVLMQIVNRIERLKDNTFDFRNREKLFLGVHDINEMPKIHLAELEHEENAVSLGADNHLFEQDNIRVGVQLLEVV